MQDRTIAHGMDMEQRCVDYLNIFEITNHTTADTQTNIKRLELKLSARFSSFINPIANNIRPATPGIHI